jgi:hypothetical protein
LKREPPISANFRASRDGVFVSDHGIFFLQRETEKTEKARSQHDGFMIFATLFEKQNESFCRSIILPKGSNREFRQFTPINFTELEELVIRAISGS